MKRLVLVALSVFGLCVAAQPVAVHAQAKAKAMTASGAVKSVTNSSLTIVSGGKDMTFTIDNNTKFVGKGLSTKTKGARTTASAAVAMNDQVSVTYHDMGGTMHAANVRITSRAMVKK
jgi:hypothetical protein